jgi:hypothetical protein
MDIKKTARANKEDLCVRDCKHGRSIIKYAAVVWHSTPTIKNSADIQRFQISALSIKILL